MSFVSQGCRIMSWTGIPRAAACVTHLMLWRGSAAASAGEQQGQIFHISGKGREGACQAGLIWLFVHTNHTIAAFKWEKLVFSVTNWPPATRALRERGNREGKHGERALNERHDNLTWIWGSTKSTAEKQILHLFQLDPEIGMLQYLVD